MELKWSVELITMLAAGFLSLVFSYFPWVARWYNALNSDYKRLVMLGVLVFITGVGFALGCTNLIPSDIPCTQDGVVKLIWLFILALIANQSVDRISPKVGEKTSGKG